MTSRILSCALVAGLLVTAGCDDESCQFGAAPLAAALELRNPDTGLCQVFGGGGGGTCDSCGNCDDIAVPEPVPNPDWAQCYAFCEGLDESSCLAASGCRAAYVDGTFHECWGTAPSGPIQGGDCTQLDSQSCSQHDDCVANHAAGSPVGAFLSCAPEAAGCYGDDECGEGSHCNASDVCLPPPDCDPNGQCPDVCYGHCVPDTVGDAGSCVGDVTCADPEPDCPADTVAGRKDGCWTGFCIPIAQCDQLPACDTLDEPDCVNRSDCSSLYQGLNCSCNGSACTCQDWVFDICEAS